MNVTRYVATRLIEAMLREVRACFARDLVDTAHNKTLAAIYGDRVTAFAAVPASRAVPWSIEVSIAPAKFDQGTSALNNVLYQARVMFHYPNNIDKHVTGENSVWDHPYTLRDWLFEGGTWKVRMGDALKTRGSLEDPAAEGVQLARLDGIQIGEVEPGPDNTTTLQTLIAVYDTRETDRGGLK